jgi:hypothetical protein
MGVCVESGNARWRVLIGLGVWDRKRELIRSENEEIQVGRRGDGGVGSKASASGPRPSGS